MIPEVLAKLSTPITYEFLLKKTAIFAIKKYGTQYRIIAFTTTHLSNLERSHPIAYHIPAKFINVITLLWYNYYVSDSIKRWYFELGEKIEQNYPDFYDYVVKISSITLASIFSVFIEIKSFATFLAEKLVEIAIEAYKLGEFIIPPIYDNIIVPIKTLIFMVPGTISAPVEWSFSCLKTTLTIANTFGKWLDSLEEGYEEVDFTAFINGLYANYKEVANFASIAGQWISYVAQVIYAPISSLIQIVEVTWSLATTLFHALDIFGITSVIKSFFDILIETAGIKFFFQEVSNGHKSNTAALKDWWNEPSDFLPTLINNTKLAMLEAKTGHKSNTAALKDWWNEPSDTMEPIYAFIRTQKQEIVTGHQSNIMRAQLLKKQIIESTLEKIDSMKAEFTQIQIGHDSNVLAFNDWWEQFNIIVAIVESTVFAAMFITIFGSPVKFLQIDKKLSKLIFAEKILDKTLSSFGLLVLSEIVKTVKARIQVNSFDIEEEPSDTEEGHILRDVEISSNTNDIAEHIQVNSFEIEEEPSDTEEGSILQDTDTSINETVLNTTNTFFSAETA